MEIFMKIKQKVYDYTNTSMEANISNICEFWSAVCY